jgi:four helix bundle protein
LIELLVVVAMTPNEMKQRTKAFALRVITATRSVSDDFVGRRLGDQLLRSGTSVAANYRAACRARSTADFINKLGIAEEEADESLLWMELLVESGLVPEEKLGDLMQEADELTAIITASRKTAKSNR